AQVDQRLGLGPVAVNAHDLDGLAGGKPEELKRLKRARGFSSAPVGQENTPPRRDRPRNDHHRSRTSAQNLSQSLVRLLLGLEVEMRLPPQDEHLANPVLR